MVCGHGRQAVPLHSAFKSWRIFLLCHRCVLAVIFSRASLLLRGGGILVRVERIVGGGGAGRTSATVNDLGSGARHVIDCSLLLLGTVWLSCSATIEQLCFTATAYLARDYTISTASGLGRLAQRLIIGYL